MPAPNDFPLPQGTSDSAGLDSLSRAITQAIQDGFASAAERQAALEFAQAGKMNPSDTDFDAAVSAHLQALRSAAPSPQAQAQMLLDDGIAPAGMSREAIEQTLTPAGVERSLAQPLVQPPVAEMHPELAPGMLYNRQATLAPTGTGSRYSSYQSGLAPDVETREFAPDVEAPASFDLVAPARDRHLTEAGPVGGSGGRGFGGGGSGGGFNGGGGGFGGGSSLAEGDDGPGRWSADNAAGAEYLRRKKQRDREGQANNYRPDSSNDEPMEASYAEPDYIDSDARAYNTGWRGRVQEARDTMQGGLQEAFKSKDMAFAVGFGAMQSLSGLTKAVSPAVGGEYYNPAQVEEQAATSALPLVGSIVGTVVGGRLGPAGALAGQFVGGSVGQTAEDLIDQYSAGHTFAQQKAGMSLGEGRGGPEAVDEFVNALRGAATPAVKELADSMATLGKTGVVSPGAASTFGAMQFTLGPDYSAAISSTAHYLESSPALAGERVKFGQGTFTADELYAESSYAYGHGDFEAGQNLAATATARNTPPDVTGGLFSKDWAKALKESVVGTPREQKGGLTTWETVQEDWTSFVGGSRPGVISPANQAKAAKEAARGQTAYEDYEAGQAAQAQGAANVSVAAGTLQLAQIGGAGAAQMRGLLPGLSSSLGDVRATYEQQIGRDTRLMQEYPHDAAIQQQGKTDITTLRGEETKEDVLGATVRKGVFQTGLQEEEATFGLEEARGVLGGKSGDQLFKARQARGTELSREAQDANNPLNPAQRAQMETEAAGIQYSAKTAAYSDRLQGLDIGAEKAGLAVSHARSFDTPGALYQAQTGELDAYKGKIAELSSELAAGGLKLDDYKGKQSQLIEVQGHVSQITAQRRDEQIANNSAIAGAKLSIDTAGLADQLQVGGSVSVDRKALDADWAGKLKADQDAVAQFKPGSVPWYEARAKVAEDTAQHKAADDALNQYRPNIETQIGDIRAGGELRRSQSAFHRAELAPYSEEGGNPLTHANQYESQINRSLGQVGVEERGLDDYKAQLTKEGRFDKKAEADYLEKRNSVEEQRDTLLDSRAEVEHDKLFAFGRMLPEVEARGGGGVGSSVVTYAALSASLGANTPYSGSWANIDAPAHGVYGGSMGYGGAAAAHGPTSPAGHPAIAGTPYTPMSIKNGTDATGRHRHTEGGLIDGKMLHDLHRQHSAATLLDTGQDVSVLTGQVLGTHRRAPAHSDLSGKMLDRHHTDAFSLATGKPISLAGQSGVPYLPSHPDIEHPAIVGAWHGAGSRGAGVMTGSAGSTEGAGNLANRFGVWAGNPADFTKAHPNVQAAHDVGAFGAMPLHAPTSDGGGLSVTNALLARIAQALESHPRPSATLPQAPASGLARLLGHGLNAYDIH